MGKAVLQYNHCTCDTIRVLGAVRWADWARRWALGRRWARGWARRHDTGLAQVGRSWGAQAGTQADARAREALRRQAAGEGGTGVRALGSRGRAEQAAGARQRRGRGKAGARGACGLGAGRADWPWDVHSVHSAYFRFVLTRYCS